MFKGRDRSDESQQEFWVETRRLPKATASTFYRKLDDTLDEIGFTEGVREICRPAYADASRGGRPGIDPAVYFKMLMIGFFENLPSERAIASRCADSLSLRAFLGYQLDEATPDQPPFFPTNSAQTRSSRPFRQKQIPSSQSVISKDLAALLSPATPFLPHELRPNPFFTAFPPEANS